MTSQNRPRPFLFPIPPLCISLLCETDLTVLFIFICFIFSQLVQPSVWARSDERKAGPDCRYLITAWPPEMDMQYTNTGALVHLYTPGRLENGKASRLWVLEMIYCCSDQQLSSSSFTSGKVKPKLNTRGQSLTSYLR